MNLFVRRIYCSPQSTVGQMMIDGKQQCFTLEPSPDRAQFPSIPAGSYSVTLRESKRFQRLMPHIENVPGRSDIEIHWGNTAKDTEGCLLVGKTMAADYVGDSRLAFAGLYEKLAADNGPHNITIVDPVEFQPSDIEID